MWSLLVTVCMPKRDLNNKLYIYKVSSMYSYNNMIIDYTVVVTANKISQ